MSRLDPEALAKGIVDIIKRALKQRDEKIARLESDVAELHTKTAMLLQKQFKQNMVVCDEAGSSWMALRATTSQPGTSSDWRLIADGGLQ
jgi:hypothetical protein